MDSTPGSPTTRMPRRRAVLAAAAAAIALAVAAPVPARAADPVTIGVLVPLTGNFAVNGKQIVDGIKIYLDQVGNQAGGHPLTVVVEDTQGKPDVAVTKAQKLVERDGAQVLTGLILSSEAIAVNDYSRKNEVPLVLSGDAGEDTLTMPGPLLNPYLVRTSQNGRTPAAVAADWVYKKGWHKVATIASDYAGGVDVQFEFARAFCKLGGAVAQAQWPPINTPDFGPYLTNLDRSVPGVVVFEPGADGLRLGQQYAQFGVKLPVMDIFGTVAYEANLPQLDDAVLGVYSSLFYTPMLKTQENQRFVAAFKKRNGSLPSNEGVNGYVGAHAIVDAVNAVGGDLADKKKFMAALRAIHFDSPKGEVALDKYGQVIQSMYIREVEKADGQLGNVPIAAYQKIDQFWPFTEAEYMSFKYDYRTGGKDSITDCGKLLAKK